jgi:hypothetical protein
MAGVYSALAAIPVWGWIAAAVVALFGASSGKKAPSMGDAYEGRVVDGIVTGSVTGGGYDKSIGGGDALSSMATAFASTYNGVLAEFGKKAEYDLTLVYRQRRKSGEKSGELRMNGESIDMGTGKEYSLQNMFESVMSTGLVNAFQKSALPDQIKKLFEGFERFDMTGVTTAIAAIVNMNQFLKTEGTTLEDFIGSMDFEAYRLEGEKNVDIVSRMLTSIMQMNTVFDRMGLTFFDLSSKGFDAIKKLQDAFGGIEGLSQKLQSYYENYYTAEEKRLNIVKDITAQLNAAGGSFTEERVSSMTKEQFRTLYETTVATAGAASDFAITLLGLEDVFAGIANTVESLVNNAQSAYGVLERVIARDKKVITDKYNLEVEAINKSLALQIDAYAMQEKAASESVGKLRSIYNALSAALNKTLVNSFEANFARQDAARAVIRTAASSDDIYAEGLEEALGTLDGNDTKYYATFEEYAAEQLRTSNDITKLKTNAEFQLNTAELILQTLKQQREDADLNAKAQLEALRLQYEQDVKALDQSLEIARSQLDALLGLDISMISVKDALLSFQTAITSAMQASMQAMAPRPTAIVAGANAGTTTTPDAISSLYQSVLGRTPDAEGLAYWTEQAAALGGVSNILSHFQNAAAVELGIPQFASGGYYSGGLALVGEQGPELINFNNPGQVYTASQTANMLEPSGDNSEMLAELIQEVRMLRAEARATAVNTSKTARILDDVSQGGTELRTEVVA